MCVCARARLGLHQFGGQHIGYRVLQVCFVLLHSTACTSVLRVLVTGPLGQQLTPPRS